MSHLPRGLKKELREVVKRALKQGCTIETSGGNHWKLRTPDGHMVIISLSPRNTGAAVIHVRSNLRQRGVIV